MIIELKENVFFSETKDILIRDNNKLLKIFYGGNGDLYFDIFGDHNVNIQGLYTASFCINQSEDIYQYFEQLVGNIIDCKVFSVSDIELELCNSDEEIADEMNNNRLMNENLKTREAYQQLVKCDSIVWYSDNMDNERANVLKIEKNNEDITLSFIDNPDDSTFGFGIRICNSGSKYDPFNLCFMRLFNQLQSLEKSKVKKL